jgi:hypothetical protein
MSALQMRAESLNNQRLSKIVTADVIVNSLTDVEKHKEQELILSCKELYHSTERSFSEYEN